MTNFGRGVCNKGLLQADDGGLPTFIRKWRQIETNILMTS